VPLFSLTFLSIVIPDCEKQLHAQAKRIQNISAFFFIMLKLRASFCANPCKGNIKGAATASAAAVNS
jgi:hypothetical protein